jgi:ubiquinone/menaquinone biosynthesis C-methylase UbiE
MTSYEDWNRQLVAFHRAFPGSTTSIAAKVRLPDGTTSYDLLASRIHELAPHARDILDVGCGDGTLLLRIAQIFGPSVRLTGIDLSDAELAKAREKLPAAGFIGGDASEVDLGNESYDVVTSHLTFMVMPRLRAVLSRVRKTLRTEGVLAFVSEDPLAGGAIIDVLIAAGRTLRDRFGTTVAGVPEREGIEREETLRALLADTGFRSVEVEAFCPRARLSPEELWTFVERAYQFGLLDASLLSRLHDAMRADLAAIAGAGEAGLALRLVVARV